MLDHLPWISSQIESVLETEGPRVRASPASLRCGPWARHIYPSLVLVQPRKYRPCLTDKLLMGHKESKQTKKLSQFKRVNTKHNISNTSWVCSSEFVRNAISPCLLGMFMAFNADQNFQHFFDRSIASVVYCLGQICFISWFTGNCFSD